LLDTQTHWDFAAMWNHVPQRYQADSARVKNAFAAKLDDELWEAAFRTVAKSLRVVRAKKELLLASPLLAQVPPELSDALAKHGDQLLDALEGVAASEIKTVAGLKQLDISSYVRSPPVRTLKVVANPLVPEKYLAHWKHELVSQSGDEAVVRITIGPLQGYEQAFRRIDGRWFSKDDVDNWSTKLAAVLETIEKIEITPQIKAEALASLRQIDESLDRLAAAADQAAFDGELSRLTALVVSVKNLNFGGN
jgi:hypothetical protein